MVEFETITCEKAVELYHGDDSHDVAYWDWDFGEAPEGYVKVELKAYPEDDDYPMITLMEAYMTTEEFMKLNNLESYT